jgi:hypothetical protein
MARTKTPIEIKIIEVEDDSPAVLDAWVQATETLMRIRERIKRKGRVARMGVVKGKGPAAAA